MSLTSIRIREIRKAICLSQSRFGAAFTSQKVKGKRLDGRAVSHWETGNAEPTHVQLRELIEFLVEPREWLCQEMGEHGFTDFTALNFLVWFHPEDVDTASFVEPGVRFIVPRRVPRRRKRIETLVFDVLDQHIEQDEWMEMLTKMSTHSSPRWNKEVATAKSLANTVGPGDISKESLAKDLQIHGPGLMTLVTPDFSRLNPLQNMLKEVAIDLLPGMHPATEIEGLSLQQWLGELNFKELFAFVKGLRMVALTLEALQTDSETREKYLTGLLFASCQLSLLGETAKLAGEVKDRYRSDAALSEIAVAFKNIKGGLPKEEASQYAERVVKELSIPPGGHLTPPLDLVAESFSSTPRIQAMYEEMEARGTLMMEMEAEE